MSAKGREQSQMGSASMPMAACRHGSGGQSSEISQEGLALAPSNALLVATASPEPDRMIAFIPFQGFIRGMSA